MGNIFKAYDIRGAYPDELDEKAAKKIGASFVTLLNAQRIVVAHDMRTSATALVESFTEGAMEAGASVTDIGMTSTPLLYFALIEGNFDGGVMVTASHLPGRMNGFKLCRESAIPLSGDQGLPALENLFRSDPLSEKTGISKGSYHKADLMDRYIDRLAGFVENPSPLKIVVDPGNGMGGPETVSLMNKFPMWEMVPMYMEPDGNFPYHVANPLLPSATRDLQERVVKEKADIGVAFDGDADRCGFIDEKGERIPTDLILALIAEYFLIRYPGETILYDLRASRIVPEVIARLGGKGVRWRVGHAFIKAGMREVNAVFAGELSSHYYFRDMGFTDNGLFTMIQMLNILSLKKKPLTELIQPLRKYAGTGEINLEIKNRDGIFEALEARYADARKNHLDGLTVEYDTWWFNLRASNTEPVIRLNLEAEDAASLRNRREEVLNVIREADPQAVLVIE